MACSETCFCLAVISARPRACSALILVQVKKRIPPRLAADYPPVLLWLDDLEEMEGLLKGWASTVKFKTATTEYDSVAELKSDVKDDEISKFVIECSSPFASVELLQYYARVYVSASEDPANVGVFHSLDEMMKRRVRKFQRVFLNLGFILALNTVLAVIGRVTGRVWVAWLGVPVGSLWCAAYLRGRWNRHSSVRLEHRGSSRNYWKRNKDTLLTTVLTSAITALVSGAIGYLIGQQQMQSRPSTSSEKSQAAPITSPAMPSPTATLPR